MSKLRIIHKIILRKFGFKSWLNHRLVKWEVFNRLIFIIYSTLFNIIHISGYPTSGNNLWIIFLVTSAFWWYHLAGSNCIRTHSFYNCRKASENLTPDNFLFGGHCPFLTQNSSLPKNIRESDPWQFHLWGVIAPFWPKIFPFRKADMIGGF